MHQTLSQSFIKQVDYRYQYSSKNLPNSIFDYSFYCDLQQIEKKIVFKIYVLV
jgi:hypothetical protein